MPEISPDRTAPDHIGPILPPPVRPPSRPAGRKRGAQPAPSAAVAVPQEPAPAVKPEQPSESLLTNMFVNRPDAFTAAAQNPAIAALMGIRQVDPEKDVVNVGFRLPKYHMAAVKLISNMTGKSLQTVAAEAFSGVAPIPPDVLDAAFMELYGYERPANG